MASILRSSKFVRYIAGFARNVVINTPREFDGNFVNTSQCLCGAIANTFSSQTAIQHDQSLEKSLKRIDQDVRKSGRISRRDIEDVLEELRNSRSATTSQSLLVIRCCGNLVPEELPEVRTKIVKEIWNTLNRLNIPMDVSHYNALLRVYLENEHPFSPVEFLAEMKEKGVEPNRVTYQRLIARYCQDGDIEGATSVLEHMRQKELPVNEQVFNALIVGHSQSGDMESAHGILSIMAQAGLEPSADTYTTLMCGYAKKGNIETIQKLIQECEAKEVYLLDKDYLDICYTLGVNNQEQHLPIILSKMHKSVGYNQDAVNVILNLTNKGKEKAAYQILKTMVRNSTPDGAPLPSGGFFIKQLVKTKRPIENILEICNKLETDGLCDRSLTMALEVSLQHGYEDIAFKLLDELREQGKEIRQHFFWPLIRLRSKDEGNNGVIRIIKQMKHHGITPNTETIRDYVIPSLKGKSSEIIATLNEVDISIGICALNLSLNLLKQDKIQDVAALMTKITAYYNPDILKRPLNQALSKTKDINSYTTILREIYEGLDRRFTAIKEDNLEPLDKSEVIGEIIVDLTYNKNFPIISDVLKALTEQGLGLSTKTAERIQERLGEKVTDEISTLLGNLSSGELTPVPLSRKPPVYTPSHQMNVAQLEKLIENCSAKKLDVRGLKRQLLTLYYRAKNVEKTEILLEDLQNSPDFFFTGGIYAQLMDLYAHHENLEKAMYYFDKLKEIEGENLSITDSKLLRLAYVMYKNDKLEEALKLLKETPRDRSNGEEERNFNYTSIAWRFLNSLADEGRVEDLENLFNLLVSKEYISVNNVLLGPLVKVHLVNNALDKALDKFEECVTVYKATPWKNELACRLIQVEDAEKLQKLTDLSTLVHGEINSLYDLVFAFVECGRVRQARKILETPGLQNRPKRLNNACERYRQEGLVKPLEDLKDATKDLNHIDRSDIYYQLLLSYIKENSTEKALGLWTQMQEEDLPPTDQFLTTLAQHLQSVGVTVPFITPEQPQQIKIQQHPEAAPKTSVQVFRSLLKNGEHLEAFELRRSVDNKWNILEASELIEKLTQSDELEKAATVTLELLEKKNPPINRIFKFVVNKLALAGKVDEINAIGDKINMDMKKIISFDNRLCHATIVAGRAKDYLDILEKEIDQANTPEDVKVVCEKFPRGGAYGILDKHPELIDKYETIVNKYSAKGYLAPANVLWTHYFTQQNYEKAETIWKELLKDEPRIMFQRIVQVARETNNEELITKLIEHLKSSKITEGALGNAYSCLLDVKVATSENQAIIDTFENVLKNVAVEYLNRTAVLRVKNVYDLMGKEFNYKIPNKNTKNQTSSSSSSDLQHK